MATKHFRQEEVMSQNLDLTILSILDGTNPAQEIELLVEERRKRRSSTSSDIAAAIIKKGWKGKAIAGGVVAGLGLVGYGVHRYLKGQNTLSPLKGLKRMVFTVLDAAYSKETGVMVVMANFDQWVRFAGTVLEQAGIPIAPTLLRCVAQVVAATARTLPKEAPTKRELKKAADVAVDKEFGHIKDSGGEAEIEERLSHHPHAATVMKAMWDDGKKHKWSLFELVYFNSTKSKCLSRRPGGRFIDLTGVSPDALDKAFRKYLGMDYAKNKRIIGSRGKKR